MQTVAPASPLHPAFQQQRFPVERLRTLLTNLFHEVSCDDCGKAKDVLFRPFLDMDDESLEGNFFDAAQKIYTFVYYPPTLQDQSTCDEDRKALQAVCKQFRKAYPFSPFSSLLSFVNRNPAEVRLEIIDVKEKADEDEKLANASRVLTMVYLNSTALWLQSSPVVEDSPGLPGMPMMKVLKDRPAMLARIEQRQEIELMRLQFVLELFRSFELSKSNVRAGAVGAAVGIVLSVATGPGILLGAGMTAATTAAGVKTNQLLKRILTRSPPEGLTYTQLSEEVSYAYNDRSSGLKRWNESKTFGYLRIFLTSERERGEMHYCEFHQKEKEQILPQALGEMYEHMRDVLDRGVLTTARLLAILTALKNSTLPPQSDVPPSKLIDFKTEVFLLALLPHQLRGRNELDPEECRKVREMVLENISAHDQLRRMTEEHLNAIINDTERMP